MANTDSVLNNQKVLIKVTLTKLCLDEKKCCQRFSANQGLKKTIANFAALNAGCLYLVCVIIFLFVFDLLKCILLFVFFFLPNLV